MNRAVPGQSALDTVKNLNGKPTGFCLMEQLIHEQFDEALISLMSNLLLICADTAVSDNIIHKMSGEYTIWHVAHRKDAMAWLKKQQPESIIMDLDLLGDTAHEVLDQINVSTSENCTLIIGLCENPEPLSPSLTGRLDQLMLHHSI